MMVTFHNFQRIHLVGIGGIGMSGIAEVLLTLGYSVSGSDTKPSPITERLQNLGAAIHEGHKAANVEGAHVVVTSSAIKNDNPEVMEAHKRKIPVIPRAEMLAELMRLKYGIAVAGAHGKTTTTSMVASVLAAAHLDPTFVVGGKRQSGRHHRPPRQRRIHGRRSRRKRPQISLLAPVVAVVTTIDREHLDQYSSLEEIQDVFIEFVNRVPFYGAAILCLDEPNVQAIIPQRQAAHHYLWHFQPSRPGYQRHSSWKASAANSASPTEAKTSASSISSIRRASTMCATPPPLPPLRST